MPRALFVILLVGTLVRAAGLGWGIPNGWVVAPIHPDEATNLQPVQHMLAEGTWNPGFFSYGTLYSYLVLGLVGPLQALGFSLTEGSSILLARLVTLVLGVGMIPLMYLLAERLFDRRTGRIAAWLMALAPGPALHSAFATVDIPASFFALGSLYATVCYAQSQRRRALWWAACLAGLAAATKYPSGLVLIAALTVIASTESSSTQQKFLWLGQSLAFALLGFLIGCPYALLDFPSFWHSAYFELFQHTVQGHGQIFEQTGNGFVYFLTTTLPYNVGVLTLLAAVCGLSRFASLGAPIRNALLVYGLTFVILLSLAETRFMRYALPIVPVVLLASSGFLAGLMRQPPHWHKVALALLAFHGIPTLLQARGLLQQSSQEFGVRYLASQAAPGETVSEPFPVLFPQGTLPPLATGAGFQDPPISAIALQGLQPSRLDAIRPDWFLIGEVWWNRAALAPPQQASEFFADVDRSYELVATYSTFPPAHRWVYGMPEPPADWIYPFVEKRIYHRVAGKP